MAVAFLLAVLRLAVVTAEVVSCCCRLQLGDVVARGWPGRAAAVAAAASAVIVVVMGLHAGVLVHAVGPL